MAKLENNKNTEEKTPDQPKKKVSWILKILVGLIFTIIGLFALLLIAINLPVTKRYIADQAIQLINKDFKAGLTAKDVEVNFFGDVSIKDFTIKDYKGFDFIKGKELQADTYLFEVLNSMVIQKKNNLNFKKLALINADVKVITYKGDSIDNFNRYITNFESNTPPDPKKPPFRLNTKINIIDTKLSIVNQNQDGDEGKWLDAKNLNLYATNVKVLGANINADIQNFSFITERWGKKHIVDTFSGQLEMTKQHLKLTDLVFNTDHSLLQGNITFNIDPVTKWQDFANKVIWDMDLRRGSQISGYDISYFVTRWDNYQPIALHGKMDGTLNNFRLNDFVLNGKNVVLNSPKMTFKDLLKGNYNIQANEFSARLTYEDLKKMLPGFINKKMGNFADPFGNMNYKGAVKVNKENVLAKGNLITSIGQANLDMVLSEYTTSRPHYKGVALLKDFNSTAITKSPQVGLITGRFNVDGYGFNLNTLRVTTKSDIQRIDIAGKSINNLALDGVLDSKRFNGKIIVNDEQAKGNINGIIDFSTKKLYADIKGELQYVNLNYFGYKDAANAKLSGKVDGKITFTNLNDLNLDARLGDVNFSTAKQKISFPFADVKAYFDNGNRVMSVNAPTLATGKIEGKFNLADLGKMVKSGLSNVLVGYHPDRYYRGQNFSLNFDVRQDLINYFLPDLHIPNQAHIDGVYTGNTNDLILNINTARLKYIMTKTQEISEADKALAFANPDYKIQEKKVKDSVMADSINVKINTTLPQQQIWANVHRIEYNKNVIRNILLTANNENNQILHLATNFKMGSLEEEDNNDLKEYSIKLNQSKNPEGNFVFRFEPTEIKYHDVVWQIDTSPELNHSIVYNNDNKHIKVNNLKLFSDKSNILVNGEFISGKDFNADIAVENFTLDKILSLVSKESNVDIKGITNGTAKITMTNGILRPLVDVKVEDFTMNGKKIGSIILNAKDGNKPNIYDIEAKVESEETFGYNKLSITGSVNNNTPSPTLDLVASLKELDISFAGLFLKSIFTNLRGKATGDVKITGPLNNIDYSGDINTKGLGFKLNFSGVDYNFQDSSFSLAKGIVTLNPMKIKDHRDNSSAVIAGNILFDNLSDVGLNLIINADNIMLLNTTQKDMDTFWGKVYASGDIYIDGSASKLRIATPNARVLSNSEFNLNSSSTSSVDEFKMLRFINVDQDGKMIVAEKKPTGANIDVDLTLSVDKTSTVNVFIADNMGNISVKGDAKDLNFRLTRTGVMTMRGKYTVDNGTFDYKTAVLSKTFLIEKNSSIIWDGDVVGPALDIKADYITLVSNMGEYLAMGQLQPTPVQLQVGITNTLKKPDVQFYITSPEASGQVKETLAFRLNTEDEKVKQFGSILALGSFITTGLNVGDLSTTGYNTLFKALANVLNTINKDFKIDLSVTGNGDMATSNYNTRGNASLSYAVSSRLNIKGGLGIPLNKSLDPTVNYYTGEGSVEYDVSKNNDGSTLLRAYSKPSALGLVPNANTGANQSYGMGIVFTKSFNSFFGKKKKNKKTDEQKTEKKNDSIRKKNTVK